MTEFRVLTLWQPWASFIALGLKQYETRSWDTNYRGKLLIHAALRPMSDKDGLITTFALGLHKNCPEKSPEQWHHLISSFRLGCIVAISDLTSTLQMMDTEKIGPVQLHPHLHLAINSVSRLEHCVGDWRQSRFAWRLENIIALPEPIPYKNGQGLRKLQDDVIAQQLHTLVL